MPKKVRFSAIKNIIGTIGCCQSHIEVLEMAKKNKYQNILILEDDFEFVLTKTELDVIFNNFFNLYNDNFDVFQIGYDYRTIREDLKNLFFLCDKSSTTSCYLVNINFYDILLSNYKRSLKIVKEFYSNYNNNNNNNKIINFSNACHDYHFDNYVNQLRNSCFWVMCKLDIGRQNGSIGDISTSLH